MIEALYYWKQHPLLFIDDIHIHGCIDETYLSHLKSPYSLFSIFGLDFSGGSSFTSWMKEHMLIILMHLTFFWSSIIGHWILTYVVGADLI